MFSVAGCGNKTSETTKPSEPIVSDSSAAESSGKASEEPTPEPVTDSTTPEPEVISINGYSIVSVGESVTLTATVDGATWTSSDDTVATVSNGNVTALKAGTVVITAAKSGCTAGELTLTVVDNVATVGNTSNKSGASYTTKGVVLSVGKNGFILADKAGMENAVYAWGKTNAAKVNVGDVVMVTGTIDNGDYGYEFKTSKVTALDGYTIDSFTNDPVVITPDVLDSYDGYGIVYGVVKSGTISEDGTYTNLEYPSDAAGSLKFSFDVAIDYNTGTYDVYGYLCAKTKDGGRRNFIASEIVDPVSTEPETITIVATDNVTEVVVGESVKLNAVVAPYYACDEVSWSVSGNDKVTISDIGLLTVATDAEEGEVVVTATTKYEGGTKTGSYTLKIVAKTVTLSGQEYVTVGESVDYAVSFSKDTVEYTLESSNSTVATITDGKVVGVKAGTANITIKPAAGSGYREFTKEITVLDNITTIKGLENSAAVDVKGKVVASDNYGYILADDADYVYVYSKNNAMEVGYLVHVVGTVSFDNSKYTFEVKPTTADVLDSTVYNDVVPGYTASDADEAAIKAITIADGAKYVKVLCEVKDNKIALGSVSVSINGSTTVADGIYNVTGYIYLNNSKYYMYVTDTAEATRPNATALTFDQGATAEIGLEGSITLSVTQAPAIAADELVWSLSDGAHATVVDGVVTLTEDAVLGETFTVTVASAVNADVKTSITLTVVDGFTTETYSIKTIATANEWVNATSHTELPTGSDVVSINTTSSNSTPNTGKYYSSGHEWRIYQAETGKVVISVSGDHVIKSVTLNYNTANYGIAVYNNTNYTSGTKITIDSLTSVEIGVGNTGNKTNGQVKITGITVSYK